MSKGKVLKGKVKRARTREQREKREWNNQLQALNWRRKRTAELLRSYRKADKTEKPSLLKLYRLSRGLAAKSRAKAVEEGAEYREARTKTHLWEKTLRAFRKAIRRPYPHLSGDLDADARVLRKLEAVAKDIGRNIYVTSGLRSQAEQKALYDNRHTTPFPVAFCCPCSSKHCLGDAADATVGGVPIQHAVSASTLQKHGLEPLIGDAVHVEG